MIKGSKICGISDLDTLNFIINHPYPPQFIGFICNYKKSSRYVEVKKLNELLKLDKKKSNFVAVLVKPDQTILEEIKHYDLAKLLIVTKNQSLNDICDLINKGFKIFGENRVQEAKSKYQTLCETKKINLHLIGPLQTNKVKDALSLFNTIQSIDRIKLVDEISKLIIKGIPIKTKSFYIQINI